MKARYPITGDRAACIVVAATHGLNTLEVILMHTTSELAWREFVEPALDLLHDALNVQRHEFNLRPTTHLPETA